MIPILYESTETAFVSNGLGRLLDCISCKVTEERNGIYECDFEYPVSGTHYDEIYPGRIIGVIHDDAGDVQPFDIVSYSRPINGVVTFHAVHISYRLTGQVVWAMSIMNSNNALTLFGNVPGTPFTYSADFTVNNTWMAAADGVPRTVRQMLGGIEGSFLDAYGGEIEWDKWGVIIHKARGTARNMVIRYGVNMSEYSEDTDYQGTYTSCVPYWTGNVDGKDVIVRGSRVDADMASYSGRRICIPLDLTERFNTRPTDGQLGAMALQIMNGTNTNLPAQSITVNFVRLQDDPEYQDLTGLMACRLCDTIGVVFPRYNMSGRFKIVKAVFDVLKERYEEMELGTPSTTLAQALGITEVPTKSETTANLAISGDLTVGGAITGTGDVSLLGALSFVNSRNILMEDTGGTPRAVLAMSSSNNTVVGYGGYDASQGGTNVYGNNVRLYSRNPIQFNQPLAGLFKTTTESGTVPATSAHSYSTNLSASMTAPDGYNAVGIVGWQSSNFRLYPFRCEVASNSSITFGVTNSTGTATSNSTTMYFQVLWMKATSA